VSAGGAEGLERLRRLALLRDLPEARLAELARVLAVEAVPAGGLVFEEGSPGDRMYLLAEGRVRIEKTVASGGVVELAVLSPGDVLGEMALLEGLTRSARAVAQTDAVLLALGRVDLDGWLAADPMMALGFFVELLRVLGQRLRRSSRSVVLLREVGEVAAQRFADEGAFLAAVLRRLLPHLEGDWSAAAYVYNEFNDEVARQAALGPGATDLPATLAARALASGWLDAATYAVALPGPTATAAGFLVARNAVAMSAPERAEAEVALAAVGALVAAALQNVKHDAEARLRARLEQAQDSPL
jgi:CRP-like cAMP-binding protein